MAKAETRLCDTCLKNRALKFYRPDRRRSDGLSTKCNACKRVKTQTYSRDVRLKATYNITEDEYKMMLAAQGGGCAICGGVRKQNLDVDHDHKTGVVRGLLCRRCNRRLLPAALDRVAVLEQAIDYLQNPPAVKVIGTRICPS